MGHTHRSVGNKVSLYQILDAFFWFPGKNEDGREGDTERQKRKKVKTQSKSVIIPLHFCPWPKCVSDEGLREAGREMVGWNEDREWGRREVLFSMVLITND